MLAEVATGFPQKSRCCLFCEWAGCQIGRNLRNGEADIPRATYIVIRQRSRGGDKNE